MIIFFTFYEFRVLIVIYRFIILNLRLFVYLVILCCLFILFIVSFLIFFVIFISINHLIDLFMIIIIYFVVLLDYIILLLFHMILLIHLFLLILILLRKFDILNFMLSYYTFSFNFNNEYMIFLHFLLRIWIYLLIINCVLRVIWHFFKVHHFLILKFSNFLKHQYSSSTIIL